MHRANPNISRRAFTLVELLITLIVSAVIAATVITMLSATAYGSDASRTMREILVRSKIIDFRLRGAIRASTEVIDSSNDHLILWKGDDNDDDSMQNNEIQLIERDTSTHELLSYESNADTNGFTTAAAYRTNAKASYPSQRWATGVTASTITVTSAPTGGSTMVSFRITLQRDAATETFAGAEATRR